VGGFVADPRNTGADFSKYAVTPWAQPGGTVISGSTTGQGAYAVADPRTGLASDRAAYLSGGHYGVLPWGEPSGAVSAAACHDNGRWSVADPRLPVLPAASDQLVAVIRAEDGTWHRPFTTLELAALQSLIEPEEMLELDGLSDQAWRERIGNAVPPSAAQAIASEMGRALLLAWSGETFALSAAPVWVRPMVAGLMVASGGVA
jgi:site-specific DNA-cytosine methylase